MRIRVFPDVHEVRAGHPAFDLAVDEFVRQTRELSGVDVDVFTQRAAAGTKGGMQEIIITLAGPSTVAALVHGWRLWLERDRDRSLEITVEEPGASSKTVTVTGTAVSNDAIEAALREAFGSAAGLS